MKVLVLSALALALAVGEARAQHCHVDAAPASADAAEEEAPIAVTVGMRLTGGAARVPALTTTAMERRGYQGLDLAVGVAWRRVAAEARLGAYRVDGDGLGPGDLATTVAVEVTPTRAPIAVAILGGATWPTGDADAGRGMGHVMLAGGALARLHRGRVHADAAVTYARAIGDDAAHAHGTELWPLVDPMAPEDLTAELGAGVSVGPRGLSVRASALYAAPLTHGAERLIASARVELARGRYRVGVGASAPAVGDPFVGRGQLSVTYRY